MAFAAEQLQRAADIAAGVGGEMLSEQMSLSADDPFASLQQRMEVARDTFFGALGLGGMGAGVRVAANLAAPPQPAIDTAEQLPTASLEAQSTPETIPDPAPLGADPEVTARAARIQNDLTAAGVPVAPAPRTLRFSQPGKGTGKTTFAAIKPGDVFDNVSQLRPEDRPATEKPPFLLTKVASAAVGAIKNMLQSTPVIQDTDGVNILLANPDPRVANAADGLDARARHLTGRKDKNTNRRDFDIDKARWARAIPTTISDYDLKLRQGTEIIYLRWYGGDRHMVVVETPTRRETAPYVKDHGTIDWGLKTQRRLSNRLPDAKVIGVRKPAGAGDSATGPTSAVSTEVTPPPPPNLPASAGAGNGVETRAPSLSQPDTDNSKTSLPTGKPKNTGIPAESGQRAVAHLRSLDPALAANTRILPNREALPLEEIDSISDADWDHMASAEGYFDETTGRTTLFTDNVARLHRRNHAVQLAFLRIGIRSNDVRITLCPESHQQGSGELPNVEPPCAQLRIACECEHGDRDQPADQDHEEHGIGLCMVTIAGMAMVRSFGSCHRCRCRFRGFG